MVLEVSTLKELLGMDAEDTGKDTLLQFVLDNVQEVILNYCHIDELPDGLSNTAYRMAVDLYRNEGIGSAEGKTGDVTSIKEGDTEISFGSSKYSAGFAESVLKNYAMQLNIYRRVVSSCR